MKLNIVVIFGLVCLVATSWARPAEEEYAEYEDEPAPPPKKAPARSALTSRRNPLAGRGKAASTTAAPAPKEEEGEVAEEVEGEEQPEAVTSTETPKKFLKSGVVRPFRSNDDLLATLKRRREQAASNKHKASSASEGEESASASVQNEPAPKASPPSSGGRRRFNALKTNEPAPAAAAEEPAPAPARTGRRFNARS